MPTTMAYTNAQILAAVVSFWARPAISQLAMSKIASMPILQGLQNSAISMGLVNSTYNIMSDLQPFMQPLINNMLQPWLEKQFSQVPDEALPGLVRDIIIDAQAKGGHSFMDGLITLDGKDIAELKALIEKNLPMTEVKGYVIKS